MILCPNAQSLCFYILPAHGRGLSPTDKRFNRVRYRRRNGENTRSIELSDLGAPIYDCNGRLITNGYTEYFAAARPTAAALSELRKMLDDDDFEQVREKLSKGRPVAVRVPSGESGCEDVK